MSETEKVIYYRLVDSEYRVWHYQVDKKAYYSYKNPVPRTYLTKAEIDYLYGPTYTNDPHHDPNNLLSPDRSRKR